MQASSIINYLINFETLTFVDLLFRQIIYNTTLAKKKKFKKCMLYEYIGGK